MTDDVYEHYKDALRRGHAAALRGKFDEALNAYAEAARMAPDRAMPQSSLAGVLARTGRISEALEAYDVALARAPEDEASLRGRAEMLAITGRPADAADTLDRLAAVLERDGRLVDACDVARRALELAESRARRASVEALVERLGTIEGDPAAQTLARTLGTLEGGAAGRTAEPRRDPRRSVTAAAATMATAAETALAAGDVQTARKGFLEAAAAHRSIGNLHAALDMCDQGLAIAPAAGDVHLALAKLYLDRGWRASAADKLVLLGRLTDLSGDDLTRARLCAMAADRFPDDARFAAICG